MAIEVSCQTGREAALLAPLIWASLPASLQRLALFDVPFANRALHLAQAWHGCPCVCTALHEGCAVAWGWAAPMGKTGACHLIMPALPHEMALQILNKFLAISSAYFRMLMIIVPAHFRNLRGLLPCCGFHRLATLPGVSFIALQKRWVDSDLFIFEDYAWK